MGCNGGNEEELKRLIQLENTLIDNRENLNIDIKTFESRLVQMEKDLHYFEFVDGDTISLEFSNQLSKFNVIRKAYKKYVASFAVLTKEQRELEQQLTNLKLDLEEGNISKEEFKEYYRKEDTDIQALIIQSEELKQALYQLEPDYRRIAKLVADRLEKVESKLPQ